MRASFDAKSKTELLLAGKISAYLSGVVADDNADEGVQRFFNTYIENRNVECKVSDIGYGGVETNNTDNPIAEILISFDDGTKMRV